MKKYFNPIIRSLDAARKKKRPKINYKRLYPDHPAFKYKLDHLAEWDMRPRLTMAQLFGIAKEQFPKVELLDTKQLKKLIRKIVKLWKVYNFLPQFPKSCTDDLKYKLLIGKWSYEVPYHNDGIYYIDFCYGIPTLCELNPGYCSCSKFEIDEEDEPFSEKFNAN